MEGACTDALLQPESEMGHWPAYEAEALVEIWHVQKSPSELLSKEPRRFKFTLPGPKGRVVVVVQLCLELGGL